MTRKVVSIVLLAFVAVAVMTAVVRNRGDGRPSAARSQPSTTPVIAMPSGSTTVVAAPPATTARLVAFYFHGTKRCTSCNSIERLTREALKPETNAGTVEIRSVNVDEAPNAHYVQDFQLTMRTVVIAEESGGTVVRWKRLDECWDRFGDPPDYLAYVQRSFAAFRSPVAASP